MYCKVCGKELPDGADRCDECGTPVNGADTENPEQPAGGFYGGGDSGSEEESHTDSGYYQDNRNQYSSYSSYYNGEEPVYEQQSGARRGFAIASMVLGIIGLVGSCCSMVTFGILSILLGVLGLIFGILGLKSQGKGMAIAGIVMACLNLIIGILLVIVMVASMNMTSNMTPEEMREFEKVWESLYSVDMIGILPR